MYYFWTIKDKKYSTTRSLELTNFSSIEQSVKKSDIVFHLSTSEAEVSFQQDETTTLSNNQQRLHWSHWCLQYKYLTQHTSMSTSPSPRNLRIVTSQYVLPVTTTET